MSRYTVGWTEVSDINWDGLMWDEWRSAGLNEAIRRADSLARSNPGWVFVVYDTDDDALDCVPYTTENKHAGLGA